jgi:hypothetical protein
MCLPVCPAAFQRKAFPKTLKDFCLLFPDRVPDKGLIANLQNSYRSVYARKMSFTL